TLHFLVVDDHPMMRRMVTLLLNELGYSRVSEAENGEKALKLLGLGNTFDVPINFIVTDWNMPVMDGMTLLRMVRVSTCLQHLPVLMSSSQTEEDYLAAAPPCADGYLAKPLNAATLKKTIDKILVTRKPAERPLQMAC